VDDVAETAASLRDSGESKKRRQWILVVIAIAQLMIVLDTTVMNIALPSAQKQLGFSTDERQWVITAYSLTFGSLLLLGGRLSDMFGRRRTLVIGLLGFAGVSAIGGAAPNFTVLVAARALQGAFAAILAPAALSTLSVTFTETKERARAFAVYAAVAAGGSAIGLILGGMLTQWLSWRSCLYINLFFALPTAWGVTRLLARREKRSRTTLDLLGAVLAAGGLFSVVYGLSYAETHTWSAPTTIATLAGGVLLLLAFVLAELRVKNPLLPLRVVLDRTRGGSYFAILLGFLSMFGAFLFLTYFFQETLDFSPLKTGFAFLPLSAGIAIGAGLCNTKLLPRFGPRPLVPVGMVVGAGGMLWLHQLTSLSSYAAAVLGPLVILGFGMGFVVAPSITAATAGIAPQDAGVGSAMVNTSQQIGGAIGAALLSTIFLQAVNSYVGAHAAGQATHNAAAVYGYATVFGVCTLIFTGGAVLTGLLLPSGRLAVVEASSPLMDL
jgi:EmrB/QacA subfamily drug resistance transporter